jgi:hypothetical protein
MADRKTQPQETDHDRLVSRPDDPLPTRLDPAGPEARGYPADPKPEPEGGQGTNPHAGDLDYTA